MLIARFQCRKLLLTFSLLPVQLLPYHRYTVTALVFALLLAQDLKQHDGLGLSGTAEKELPEECRVAGHLISWWLDIILLGLHRAHHVLAGVFRLDGIVTGLGMDGGLNEVHGYFMAMASAGAPGRPTDLLAVLNRYSRATGFFLFGTPFQERGGRLTH